MENYYKYLNPETVLHEMTLPTAIRVSAEPFKVFLLVSARRNKNN